MFLKRRSMPKELYEEIESHAGKLTRAYELVLTTYEKNYPVHSLVICGNEVAGYTTMKNTDLRPVQDHIVKMLKENGISGIHAQHFIKEAFRSFVHILFQQAQKALPGFVFSNC